MKKKILLVLITTLIMLTVGIMSASATTIVDSGTCGDAITWSLDDEGTLIIAGNGIVRTGL